MSEPLTTKPRIVCNSRHWATMAWLGQSYPGISVEYRPGIKAHEIDEDTALITTYPLHLLSAAGDAINIEYPNRPPPPEPTPAQMQAAQATPIHYRLSRSVHPHVPETYPDFVRWLSTVPIQDRVVILADLVRRFG